MRDRIGVRVAIGILIAIQPVLEVAVALRDERKHLLHVAILGREPPLGVVSTQCPKHDVQTLIDHATIWQNEHRHRPLGRRLDECGGLVAQHHFSQFTLLPTSCERQAGSHRIGAAAERVQNRQLGHYALPADAPWPPDWDFASIAACSLRAASRASRRARAWAKARALASFLSSTRSPIWRSARSRASSTCR